MAKKTVKRHVEHAWIIYRIKKTPAEFIGRVHAPDEDAAIRKAIDEYAITNPEDRVERRRPWHLRRTNVAVTGLARRRHRAPGSSAAAPLMAASRSARPGGR